MRMKYFIISTIILGIGLLYAWDTHARISTPTYNSQAIKHEFVVIQAHQLLGFNLVDPEQAPPEIRDSVLRGYRLILNTGNNAPNYAHNELSCTNCHFLGGDT